MNIRTDSTEYIKSTITVDHDLTGKTIQVALPAAGVVPTTWFNSTVTDVTEAPTGIWTATYRLLVGPAGGALVLTEGTFDWTVKVTDTPEVPVRKAGTVVATLV